MLKNYFKVALRNLWKNKGYSAINIFGLAIGLATCLLILVYVMDETSFDKFNENASRIYRVNADIKFGGDLQKLAVCPDPMASTMIHDYPQVQNAVRFRSYGSSLVKKGDQNIKEERIIFADSTLFDVFTLPMIEGNPKKALTEPNSVVITESTAKKYFGRTDVVGQTLLFDNNNNFKITGVIKDVPEASHFNFDFFASLAGVKEANQNVWVSFNFNTYLLFRKDADAKAFEKKFDEINAKYIMPQAQQIMHISEEDFKKSGSYINFSLTPLTDIHLHSDRIAELAPNSDIQVVYIFSAVAVFILLIACVNFMNLSTARSANRAREVGVRKVLGTQRTSLIGQFLTESVVVSLISFLFALLFAALLLPYLNELASKKLSLSLISHPLLLPLSVAFVVLVGLLAGSYPAFYLSAFKPIEVLKGKLSGGFKRSYLRSSLVVFQFFISIALIIATIVIYSQLKYIQNKKLGFDKEQVLMVKDAYVLGKQTATFKNEVLKYPGFVSGTVSGYLPVPSSRDNESLFADGNIQSDKAVSAQVWRVDEDYLKTLGMEMAKGRFFSKDFLTDSTGIVINETAAGLFGFGENPIGRKVTEVTDIKSSTVKNYTVVGVIRNFNFESLRQNIGALCMKLDQNTGSVSFRLKTGDISQAIGQVQNTWKKLAPNEPFAYAFLSDDFDRMYRSEQRSGKIFVSFAVLAILIACLGLFGLVTYAAEQRTKEIGIRKVLGASVTNIVNMLSKDFLKLIGIALLLAFPLAWYFMNKWLQDFAYRINIDWKVFLIAGATAVLIAILTVSMQAIKAALKNPVKNLRTE